MINDKISVTGGYFGKLPLFMDFIKFNCGGSEIICLDKWLQEGLLLLQEKFRDKWKSLYKASPSIYFFYPFTDTVNSISGIIFPSTDKSGRHYPFIIFTSAKKNRQNKYMPCITPYQLKYSFKLFEVLFNRSFGRCSLDRINNVMKQIPIAAENHAEEKYLRYLEETSFEEFRKRTAGNNLSGLNEFLTQSLTGNISVQNVLNLSFISNKKYFEFDMGFLVQTIIAMAGNDNIWPAIFWTKGKETVTLWVLFNRLQASDYLNFIQQE